MKIVDLEFSSLSVPATTQMKAAKRAAENHRRLKNFILQKRGKFIDML